VLMKAHWLSVMVETSEDWRRPIVKLFIVYYVGHFYGGVNITASATTCITINSWKRASGNNCDAVYFLDWNFDPLATMLFLSLQQLYRP